MKDSYTLTLGSDVLTLTDRRDDGDGTDTLRNIELLEFQTREGSTLPEEFDLEAVAGTKDLTEAQMESFIELYIAYSNRAPDALGLNSWGTVFATGTSLEEMATLFYEQEETQADYPSSLSNMDFASAVYDNVLGRVADEDGLNFWVQTLEDGSVSRDQFILEFLGGTRAPGAEASQWFIEQQLADREYLSDKTDLGAYFSVHKGMSDVDNASAVMALFDGTNLDATVDSIENFYQGALDPEDGEFLMPLLGIMDDPFAIA